MSEQLAFDMAEVGLDVPQGYKRTEIGVIPEDWDLAQLSELTDVKRPISYGIVQTGESVPNGVNCLRVMDITDGKINKNNLITTSQKISNSYKRTILQIDDLVMPLRGKTGEVALIKDDLKGSNLTRGVALIALQKKYNPLFLKNFLSWSKSADRLASSMNGSALQEITIASLRGFFVAIPHSYKEQSAIATALSDVDALINELEQLIAKKQAIKTATMQQLLTGRARLPQFALRNDGSPKGYKASELGETPEDWDVEIFSNLAKPNSARVNPKLYGGGDFCLELEHISQGTGSLLGHTETSGESSLKNIFESGDILFGKLRSYLKKYWLADLSGVCSTEIWVLKPNLKRTCSGFIFYFVQTDRFILAASEGYGTHMPRADWKVIKDIPVSTPSVEEQTAIASILTDMDSDISSLQQRLSKTRQIKQGMMQELLTGKTRLKT